MPAIAKSLELRLLEGNRGGVHLPVALKPTLAGKIIIPKWLTSRKQWNDWKKLAKKEFMRVAGELKKLGIYTVIDHAVLEAYCANYARWVIIEQMLGDMQPDEEGLRHITKLQKLAQGYFKLMIEAAKELGLTPVSRGKIANSQLLRQIEEKDTADLD